MGRPKWAKTYSTREEMKLEEREKRWKRCRDVVTTASHDHTEGFGFCVLTMYYLIDIQKINLDNDS